MNFNSKSVKFLKKRETHSTFGWFASWFFHETSKQIFKVYSFNRGGKNCFGSHNFSNLLLKQGILL